VTARAGAAPDDRDALAALAPLLLFDGGCGLCDRAVRFTFAHDRAATIRAAPLEGTTAARVLAAFPAVRDVDSVLLLERDVAGRAVVHVRSDAALAVARRLGMPWAALAAIARLVPRPLRDLVYRGVARVRHRIFGRVDACVLPDPAWRARLLP
jgi:predicted DCC family thiol-disulfide oxidoreductase YuxK